MSSAKKIIKSCHVQVIILANFQKYAYVINDQVYISEKFKVAEYFYKEITTMNSF